jgi:signal transduction histidine kinase
MQISLNRYDMNLTQKVLWLIAFPLFFQVVFVLVLSLKVAEADAQTHREAQSKAIIAEARNLDSLYFQTAATFSAYAMTRRKSTADKLELLHKQAEEQYRILERQCYTDDQRKSLSELKQLTDSLTSFLNEVKGAFDQGGSELAMLRGNDSTQEIFMDMHRSNEAIQHFIESVKATQVGLPESAARARAAVQWLIGIFLCLNIVLAVSLAALVNRGFSARLSILMDNVKRITEQKPLNPELSGHDELARLDKVFHEMVVRMEDLDRMKRDMVAMINHELRTPLTSLKMFLQMLSEGNYGPISEKAIFRLDAQQQNLLRLIGLINELLEFEKLAAGRMDVDFRRHNMKDVVDHAVSAVSEVAANNGIEIVLPAHYDAELACDGDRIVQVLINFLSNAIKFSPKGSTVAVGLNDEETDLKVTVKDSGPGVPEKYREAIFEKYRQIYEEGYRHAGGTGLGLPICKLIVELHGGTIGVENNSDGPGSTFWFRIKKNPEEKQASIEPKLN